MRIWDRQADPVNDASGHNNLETVQYWSLLILFSYMSVIHNKHFSPSSDTLMTSQTHISPINESLSLLSGSDRAGNADLAALGATVELNFH